MLPAIPSSLNPKTAYVIADNGQAYLFDPSAGLTRLPFLSGVHRSFGFSYNGRYFLYLKSSGALFRKAVSRTSPGFAPGVENYAAMGAVTAVWNDRIAERLVSALSNSSTGDGRRSLGKERGNRRLADEVAERVAYGTA